mmetsp:Transcript_1120/g.3150  ORF Transcript_1120/g.3150 Transcript_1120/m.3150 type:complete len:112 (-) Transcript_1120:1050-1385(-)
MGTPDRRIAVDKTKCWHPGRWKTFNGSPNSTGRKPSAKYFQNFCLKTRSRGISLARRSSLTHNGLKNVAGQKNPVETLCHEGNGIPLFGRRDKFLSEAALRMLFTLPSKSQ